MKPNLTLEELMEWLATYYDEVSLLELLNINSYELLERFPDRVEDRWDKLIEDYEDAEEREV